MAGGAAWFHCSMMRQPPRDSQGHDSVRGERTSEAPSDAPKSLYPAAMPETEAAAAAAGDGDDGGDTHQCPRCCI